VDSKWGGKGHSCKGQEIGFPLNGKGERSRTSIEGKTLYMGIGGGGLLVSARGGPGRDHLLEAPWECKASQVGE